LKKIVDFLSQIRSNSIPKHIRVAEEAGRG